MSILGSRRRASFEDISHGSHGGVRVGSGVGETREGGMMMMIAFITMNSGLVLLIEGICAQIYKLRFEIIGGLRSHIFLLFFY